MPLECMLIGNVIMLEYKLSDLISFPRLRSWYKVQRQVNIQWEFGIITPQWTDLTQYVRQYQTIRFEAKLEAS